MLVGSVMLPTALLTMTALFDLNNLLAPLTPEEILKRVTHEELWFRYYGKFELNKKIRIPHFLRESNKEDNNPSGSFLLSATLEILLYDHAYHQTYNIFSFLRKQYPSKSFNDILIMINEDFNLGIGTSKIIKKPMLQQATYLERQKNDDTVSSYSTAVDIDISTTMMDKFTPQALAYWKSHGISEDTLIFSDVVQITGYTIKRYDTETREMKEMKYTAKNNELLFAYIFFDPSTRYKELASIKIYAPHSSNKWITNTTKFVINFSKQISTVIDYFNFLFYNSDWDSLQDLPEGIFLTDFKYSPLFDRLPIFVEINKTYETTDIVQEEYYGIFKNIIKSSSLKDNMAWLELGYLSFSQQAEYGKLFNRVVSKDILKPFEKVIINYDNDTAGYNNALELQRNSGHFIKDLTRSSVLNLLFVGDSNNKDISDYTKTYGFKETFKRYGRENFALYARTE